MDALRPPRCVPVAQSSLESRAARGHRPARGETDLLVLIFMCRHKQFHPALGYGTSGERCGRALADGIRETTEKKGTSETEEQGGTGLCDTSRITAFTHRQPMSPSPKRSLP